MSATIAQTIVLLGLFLWLFSSLWIARAPDVRSGFRRITIAFVIPMTSTALAAVLFRGSAVVPHLVLIAVAGLVDAMAYLSLRGPSPASCNYEQ